MILLATLVGGLVGAAGVVFLTRDSRPRPQLVDGQPLRYWITCLDSNDKSLRAAAASALPKFGNDAIQPLIESLEKLTSQEPAAVALATIGPPALPALRATLRSPSLHVRLGAIKTLDLMGTAAAPAASALAPLLGEDDVGPFIAELLIRVGPDGPGVAVAAELIDSGTDSRRMDAIRVLSKASQSDPRVEAALLRASQRDSRDVRNAAFKSLCSLAAPPPAATARFIEGLAEIETRFAARAALCKVGEPAIEPLKELANSPLPEVRAEAVAILAQLTATVPAAAAALPPFLLDPDRLVSGAAERAFSAIARTNLALAREQLRSPHPRLRLWAARQFKNVTPPAVDDLAPLLDDPERGVRDAVTDVMRVIFRVEDPSLLLGPASPDVSVRLRGVRLLPFAHDPKKYELMVAAMEDAEVDVRLAAVSAMSRSLSSERVVQRLVQALKSDTHTGIRVKCAQALAEVPHAPGVRAALIQSTADPDQLVTHAAHRALGVATP